MTLTLEIIGPQAAKLGGAARKVFAGAGGSIGRLPDNDWVIPDPYISGHHARIQFRDGQYLLEDTSTNGVFINSPQNRLPRGELYPLKSGDRVFIDTYEIRITCAPVAAEASAVGTMPFRSPGASQAPARQVIPDDPFGPMDLTPSSAQPMNKPVQQSRSLIPDDMDLGLGSSQGGEADPLKLLGFEAKSATAPVPRAQDLAARSPLSDHYEPPTPATTPLREPSPAVADALIPDDYDPLIDDVPPSARPSAPPAQPPSKPAARPTPGGQRHTNVPRAPKAEPVRETPSAGFDSEPPLPTPPLRPMPSSNAKDAVAFDFHALLHGAGLDGVQVTPELAANFGRILKVVVAGLMDVLRAREKIKDEFRMRMTTFKAADNNPLKFSANVEDALHNLLVKRNSAYLGPVDAFEDAFNDVRNHQMAMLAGVRLAFETMLSEFDPDKLQQQFDRQNKRGSLLAGPARLRYWELYRDRFHDMVKDPERNFRELFGAEFARAYEEQLERLKALGRSNNR